MMSPLVSPSGRIMVPPTGCAIRVFCKLHHRHKHRGFFRKVVLEDGSVVFEIRTLAEDPKRNGNGRIRHDPRPKGSGPEEKGSGPALLMYGYLPYKYSEMYGKFPYKTNSVLMTGRAGLDSLPDLPDPGAAVPSAAAFPRTRYTRLVIS